MNETDFESALEDAKFEHGISNYKSLGDSKSVLNAIRLCRRDFEIGARWARDWVEEFDSNIVELVGEIEKLKAERDELSRREIEVASCCVANEEDAKAWKEQAETLASTISEIGYQADVKQAEYEPWEIMEHADAALTAYNKFKERQVAGGK